MTLQTEAVDGKRGIDLGRDIDPQTGNSVGEEPLKPGERRVTSMTPFLDDGFGMANGIARTLGPDGQEKHVRGLVVVVGGIPTMTLVTGEITLQTAPQRPAPVGSVGRPPGRNT